MNKNIENDKDQKSIFGRLDNQEMGNMQDSIELDGKQVIFC